MIHVLHITPHMGGGVGRVLSGFAAQVKQSQTYKHHFICLENPEKKQFIDSARKAGCMVTVAPADDVLIRSVADADIVQIEFWNHPALIQLLCTVPLPAMRLLIWCHSSGLHFPMIPAALVAAAHRFVFTSPCSYEAKEIESLSSTDREKLAVVSSGGGLDQLPAVKQTASRSRLRAGYIGSLNFIKLHPDYVSFLAAVRDSKFHVRLIGDETNRATLEQQCREIGRPDLLVFYGYSTDVESELADLDLFVYLLNPTHYGTAEIALLEAMAMGVVPIVMNNRCESHIVEHRITGFVVNNAEELADSVEWLSTHEDERIAMGQRAVRTVRALYTYQRMDSEFNLLYSKLLTFRKRAVSFTDIFGTTAAEWFKSFLREKECFLDNGMVELPQSSLRYAMWESRKGSVFHFHSYFPEDQLLKKWAGAVEHMQ